MFIKRRLRCPSGPTPEYVMDALGVDVSVNATLDLVKRLQSQYPFNKSVTLWYYPTIHSNVDEHHLRNEPIIVDSNIVIRVVCWFIYMLIACSPALCIALFWLGCIWPDRHNSRFLACSISLYSRICQIVVSRRRINPVH